MDGYTNVFALSTNGFDLHLNTPQNEYRDMLKLQRMKWMNIKIARRNTNGGYKVVTYVNHVHAFERNSGNEKVHRYLKVFACRDGHTAQVGMIHNVYINGKGYNIAVLCIFAVAVSAVIALSAASTVDVDVAVVVVIVIVVFPAFWWGYFRCHCIEVVPPDHVIIPVPAWWS